MQPPIATPSTPQVVTPPDGGAPVTSPLCQASVEGVRHLLTSEPGVSLVEVAPGGGSATVNNGLRFLVDFNAGKVTRTGAALVAHAPNGRTAVFQDYDFEPPKGRLLRFDSATGASTELLKGPFSAVTVSADRRFVRIESPEYAFWLYDLDRATLHPLSDGLPDFRAVEVSPDGGRYLAAASNGTLNLFDASGPGVRSLDRVTVDAKLAGAGVAFVTPDGRLGYWSASGAQDVGRLGLGLRPLDRVSALPHGSLFFVDDAQVAWVWTSAGARQLGSRVEAVAVGASGRQVALVQGTGAVPARQLTLVSVETGATRVVHRSDQALVAPVFSDDERRLAAVDGDIPRVWRVETGAELALTPPPPPAAWGTALRFRRGGALLEVFRYDQDLAVYGLLSGRELYRTNRSVVPAEGQYSYWGPGPEDDALFTPRGGYLDEATDLYVWNTTTGVESFLGAAARRDCFVPTAMIFHRGLKDPFETHPGVLDAYTPASGVWSLSANAGLARCDGDRVLFLEDEATSDQTPLSEGRLVFARPRTRTRVALAEGVSSFVVEGDRVFYTTRTALCVAPLPR
jgi:sugar lactone lactonase YvrE